MMQFLIFNLRHQFDIWPHSDVMIPRKTLLEKVKGVDGLLCLITEKVDKELLDVAGALLSLKFCA